MVSNSKIKHRCNLAINNILKEGITDVELFTTPFELGYLRNIDAKNQVIHNVVSAIEKNDFRNLKMHKIGNVLVPKKDLCDFRKCAFIDIQDEITFLTLTLCLAKEIEYERIRPSDNRIFSYRYKPDNGYLFNKDYHFTSFRAEVDKKVKMPQNHVLVECDISNFYDRLNIHRLESSLLSIKNIDTDIVKLINETLLYWANRDSYGLPVGSNASRILAEASLINVDRFLISHKVDFCRFVDDYRIFAKDAETAHKHLALLTLCLSREGLFINTGKTKMKDISKTFDKQSESIADNEKNTVKTMEALQEEQNASEIDLKREELPKIIRGYNGLIPTKFRELTQKEEESLKNENLDECLENIESFALVEPDEVKRIIKIVAAQKKYSIISRIPLILKRFPQFIPYFVDFIGKRQNEIPENETNNVIEQFSDWFSQEDVPEYILVFLVRLFKMGKKGKNVLIEAFRNLKRTSGDYIGRALLESFNGALTRTEAIEIKDSYVRSDSWEKRQILRLVQTVLPKGEKNAFFKDVEIHNSDMFISFVISKRDELYKITTQI